MGLLPVGAGLLLVGEPYRQAHASPQPFRSGRADPFRWTVQPTFDIAQLVLRILRSGSWDLRELGNSAGGLKRCRADQAALRLSADDLPVRLSATTSKLSFWHSLRSYMPARSTALM